jgi:hypothetical protein
MNASIMPTSVKMTVMVCGSIMVLGGISRDGRTDLHVLERGTMTGVRYRDEILNVYVRPYAGAVGPESILMDDNARPHRARVVEQYFQQETIASALAGLEPDRACMEYFHDVEHNTQL